MAAEVQTFEIDGLIHDIGGTECPQCWGGYPVPCTQEGCTGLVHGSFADENANGDFWLHYECDVCDEGAEPD